MSGETRDQTGTREERLARTFVSLADTLVSDYDVVELLDRLVHACVDLLGATQAGLLLRDQRGDLHVMASSDEATRAVEVFQLQGTEGGPCSDAARDGVTVDVDDLGHEGRWPGFVAVALSEGFRSVHAVPMRLRDDTIGALGLFGAEGASLSDADRRLARALADFATIGIIQQRSLQRSSLLTDQLQAALTTRVVIEQAKGMLAEHGRTGMEEAFATLRDYARREQLKLSAVASALVSRELGLDQVTGTTR